MATSITLHVQSGPGTVEVDIAVGCIDYVQAGPGSVIIVVNGRNLAVTENIDEVRRKLTERHGEWEETPAMSRRLADMVAPSRPAGALTRA